MGRVTAAKMLQNVLNVAGDGRIGPLTLHKLDIADPLLVLADLRAAAVAHYREVVAAKPEKQIYLNGWMRRANA
jgi:lysozyme family protein